MIAGLTQQISGPSGYSLLGVIYDADQESSLTSEILPALYMRRIQVDNLL
jgi:hypothetical protein